MTEKEILQEVVENQEAVVKETIEEAVTEKVAENAAEKAAEKVADEITDETAEKADEAPVDKTDDDAETKEPVLEAQPTAEDPAAVKVNTESIEKVDDAHVSPSETKVNAEGSVHFDALTPVYTTSVEIRPARYIKGPVYIVDGEVVTGRVRVSADADGRNILGWVNVEATQCK